MKITQLQFHLLNFAASDIASYYKNITNIPDIDEQDDIIEKYQSEFVIKMKDYYLNYNKLREKFIKVVKEYLKN